MYYFFTEEKQDNDQKFWFQSTTLHYLVSKACLMLKILFRKFFKPATGCYIHLLSRSQIHLNILWKLVYSHTKLKIIQIFIVYTHTCKSIFSWHFAWKIPSSRCKPICRNAFPNWCRRTRRISVPNVEFSYCHWSSSLMRCTRCCCHYLMMTCFVLAMELIDFAVNSRKQVTNVDLWMIGYIFNFFLRTN